MRTAQRLLLEFTWEAREISGIAFDSLNGTQTGVHVYFDMWPNDYTVLEVKGGDLMTMTGHFGTANSHAVASGRVSYTLGFKGPSFTLDAACSSALIGMHQGLRLAQDGRDQHVHHLLLTPNLYINFSEPRCSRPTAAALLSTPRATASAAGVAIVVLKSFCPPARTVAGACHY